MWAPHEQRSQEVEKVKVETIEEPGELTRFHIVHSNQVELWLDTDIGEQDGICIGLGSTRRDALEDAIAELRGRLAELETEALKQ